MHRFHQDTGKLLECDLKDNGTEEPVTIILGNESVSIPYVMEWPKSIEFRYNAHLAWLKSKIKNMRGIK